MLQCACMKKAHKIEWFWSKITNLSGHLISCLFTFFVYIQLIVYAFALFSLCLTFFSFSSLQNISSPKTNVWLNMFPQKTMLFFGKLWYDEVPFPKYQNKETHKKHHIQLLLCKYRPYYIQIIIHKSHVAWSMPPILLICIAVCHFHPPYFIYG